MIQMILQAKDFKTESMALHGLLTSIDPSRFDENTQFKDWTLNCVLQHLHFWNIMADFSLTNEAEFVKILGELRESDLSKRGFENYYLEGLKGKPLLDAWRKRVFDVADNFFSADPKVRLKWGGPDMSAKSSISARLMETWAHGQEVYDQLGIQRVNSDYIRNIAHLGVNTFGYAHSIRERKVPEHIPYVKLIAASGGIWEWNTPDATSFVEGDAVEFCQVITQTRNIADTKLQVVGDVATQWMSIAQCFAGGVEEPPAVGTRFIRRNA
ncbi:TIGR03084 family metal-binding protein [Rhodobacteraceae bacterium D3-12]|nr:TIGR03084 family metal-binding protein [Rhodobacteraceae bacterium D3-12]